MPVTQVPNWGAMTSSAEWTRTYDQMTEKDFVPLPAYRLSELIIPIAGLADSRTDEHVRLITAKLAYSTRYYGRYDLDAGEYEGKHAGVDIKLALGTPLGAIGGGRVVRVEQSDRLGLYMMIEHRVDNETYFSIYGHMGKANVAVGDDVSAGQIIGTVGLTGETASPHVHLQIDRDDGIRPHEPYNAPLPVLNADEAIWTVHPIQFIQRHTVL